MSAAHKRTGRDFLQSQYVKERDARRGAENVALFAMVVEQGQLTMSVPEVQRVFGGCWRTIRRMLETGELAGFKRGNRAGAVRIMTASVVEYMKRHAL